VPSAQPVLARDAIAVRFTAWQASFGLRASGLLGGILLQDEYCKSHQDGGANADQYPHARLRAGDPI
jgi:hypothetical protein